MIKVIVEYVWIDGDNNLRSKARTLNFRPLRIIDIPKWNYDGSSTKQAFGNNSEIILKPRVLYPCPFRKNNNYIVMCDTYDTEDKSLSNNHRHNANNIFMKYLDEEPWYGIEQEFFMIDNNTSKPLELVSGTENKINHIGNHYCGVGVNYKSRQIMDEHYDACIYMGLDISGINAEVAVGQWEYQIGPSVGIDSGDQLWMSRYVIQRIAEKYNVSIDFTPKPSTNDNDINGSGCHTNFSTKKMRKDINIRVNENNLTGLDIINKAIDALSHKHKEHMEVYGLDNKQRMTGLNETASYDIFSSGVGSRSSSIRIPTDTYNNKCGYFEDRRPGSNMDPYLVTSKIMETINENN